MLGSDNFPCSDLDCKKVLREGIGQWQPQGPLSLDDKSNSWAHCWVVSKICTVFLTGLWESPLLLFSAQTLA